MKQLFEVVERNTGRVMSVCASKSEAKDSRNQRLAAWYKVGFEQHESARKEMALFSNFDRTTIPAHRIKEYEHACEVLRKPLPYYIRKGSDHWKRGGEVPQDRSQDVLDIIHAQSAGIVEAGVRPYPN